MGIVNTEITLLNAIDQSKVLEGQLKESEVRSVTVQAVVDTGSMYLAINEETRQKLGLGIRGEKTALLANGQHLACKISEPIEVWWKERQTICQAMIIPDAEKILLGAIALEGMDLVVNPVTQELVGAHGDRVETLLL